jgi:hypothetical protein
MKIKKLTDEHVKKILNNECEDIKVSPESTTMMDHDELERLCTALSQNTSANRLDLEQCGALSAFFFWSTQIGRSGVCASVSDVRMVATLRLLRVGLRIVPPTRDCCSPRHEIIWGEHRTGIVGWLQ